MEKTNKIKPLFDRVLLEREPEQESTQGIIIPTAQSDRSQIMRVVAVGDCQAVKLNERVIVAKYAGTEVNIGTTKCLIVCEHDILGVFV